MKTISSMRNFSRNRRVKLVKVKVKIRRLEKNVRAPIVLIARYDYGTLKKFDKKILFVYRGKYILFFFGIFSLRRGKTREKNIIIAHSAYVLRAVKLSHRVINNSRGAMRRGRVHVLSPRRFGFLKIMYEPREGKIRGIAVFLL